MQAIIFALLNIQQKLKLKLVLWRQAGQAKALPAPPLVLADT